MATRRATATDATPTGSGLLATPYPWPIPPGQHPALPNIGRHAPYTYVLSCITYTIVAIVNSALSFVSGTSRCPNYALAVDGGLAVLRSQDSQFWRRIAVVIRDRISLSAER